MPQDSRYSWTQHLPSPGVGGGGGGGLRIQYARKGCVGSSSQSMIITKTRCIREYAGNIGSFLMILRGRGGGGMFLLPPPAPPPRPPNPPRIHSCQLSIAYIPRGIFSQITQQIISDIFFTDNIFFFLKSRTPNLPHFG